MCFDLIFGCVGMVEVGVCLKRQKREVCRIEELELFVVGSFQRFGGKEGPGGEVGLDVSHSKHLSKDTTQGTAALQKQRHKSSLL